MRRTLGALLVLLVLPMSGCHTGSPADISSPREGASARPGGSQRADYLARVNAICGRFNAKVRALGAPRGSLRRQAHIAHLINVIMLEEMKAIRGAAPPAADAALVDSILREGDKSIRYADTTTQAVLKHRRPDTAVLAVAVHDLADSNRRLSSYGLTTCAQ